MGVMWIGVDEVKVLQEVGLKPVVPEGGYFVLCDAGVLLAAAGVRVLFVLFFFLWGGEHVRSNSLLIETTSSQWCKHRPFKTILNLWLPFFRSIFGQGPKRR